MDGKPCPSLNWGICFEMMVADKQNVVLMGETVSIFDKKEIKQLTVLPFFVLIFLSPV